MSEIIAFFIGLAVMAIVIFGTTYFAIWLRGKMLWTPTFQKLGNVAKGPSVSDLKSGCVYLVKQPFADHYGNQFLAGERLTYIGYDFLPYHGGYTINFQEKTFYLQEEENADILSCLSTYFKPAP